MKLTNKNALAAAFNAVYVLRDNGLKEFEFDGIHDTITVTANELIHKLYEMYENENNEDE